MQFQLRAQVAGNAALRAHEPEILVALPSVCPLLAFWQVVVTDGQRCAQLNERCGELCSIRRHLDRYTEIKLSAHGGHAVARYR